MEDCKIQKETNLLRGRSEDEVEHSDETADAEGGSCDVDSVTVVKSCPW